MEVYDVTFHTFSWVWEINDYQLVRIVNCQLSIVN